MQYMHLDAAAGMLDKHSGHSLMGIVSLGSENLVDIFKSGTTTTKYTTAAMTRNVKMAFKRFPYANFDEFMVKVRLSKLGWFPKAPIMGVIRSVTIALTTFVKAVPTTTATARSIKFPLKRNFLNPPIASPL